MLKLELLIIDPQKDFCSKKLNSTGSQGALFIPGAYEDSLRLGEMIDRLKKKIYDIHVTLDTHHLIHIAHPIFWKNSTGSNPAPFTIISTKDVEDGVWMPVNPGWHDDALKYVKELEISNRYPLCIWPPHCLIGTEGHSVIEPVMEALMAWERDRIGMVDYVTKGSNYRREHYSAVQAEVIDNQDPSTLINTRLIQTLQNSDIIAISGQASSHCVANTVRDIANNFGDENIKKMVFIEDTSSPVPGFESMAKMFIDEMTGRGMQICKSTDFLI